MFEHSRRPLVHSVLSLGKLRMQGAWKLELLHSSPRHRLYWITRGQGRITVNGITRGYGPNTAVFVPARCQLALELPSQTQGLELCLPPDESLGVPNDPLHLRVSNIEAQGNLTSHLEKIERELAAQAPAMDRALTAYSLLVSVWIARELTRQEGSVLREKSHRLVELFAERMEAQFRTGKGVADYAAQLQVTPTHLSRVCREASGRPAHALLVERIMSEARRLLIDTDMPAREIAEHLGFSSAAYFTRAFSQATGQTPSEFRTPARRA
ncbi:AraC family transcriptional regulator [Roseibacterium beibuensis]|uniref:Helix-turn-helix domain-containing protein n=1 Tax=[Roseibacterium] beibuensis TaxID=1193142 RepID=A0ABP9LSK5_9RHOB|nr:AraC family transcriptional regulator [Roseibacterium beibuensis]MCS6626781.1 AraC family transcriptional regulator [Roseibacterium beibuensis]